MTDRAPEMTAEEFDLYINEDDGAIYRHYPPGHPICSPTFDPEGVDIEQSETEIIEVVDALKAKIRAAELAAIERCLEIIENYYPTGSYQSVKGGISAQIRALLPGEGE